MLFAQQQIFYADPTTKKRLVLQDCHEIDQLTAIPLKFYFAEQAKQLVSIHSLLPFQKTKESLH